MPFDLPFSSLLVRDDKRTIRQVCDMVFVQAIAGYGSAKAAENTEFLSAFAYKASVCRIIGYRAVAAHAVEGAGQIVCNVFFLHIP